MTPWTSWELDVVETLARRVRMMSITQIARIWWPQLPSHKTIRVKLARLRRADLIRRTMVNVASPGNVKRPLFAWRPGFDLAAPDCHRLSQFAKRRWNSAARPTEVYWASPQAANLFGSSGGELPTLLHRDHDLLLGEVYVIYRQRAPELAVRWLGEQALPKAGYRLKDPDAFIVDDQGRLTCAVESAGRYGVQQIESFHQHCVDQQLAYELW